MGRGHTTHARGGRHHGEPRHFSWAMLEPREGEFEFGWLDRVMDGLHAVDVRVDLATASASPPPWLTHRYPEVLPVTKDGVRLSAGSRQQYCPSSPVYRRLAARLASKIAGRYADHPALAMWHINNEYGCHVSHCYCETSADAFRAWLEARHGQVSRCVFRVKCASARPAVGHAVELMPTRCCSGERRIVAVLHQGRGGPDRRGVWRRMC